MLYEIASLKVVLQLVGAMYKCGLEFIKRHRAQWYSCWDDKQLYWKNKFKGKYSNYEDLFIVDCSIYRIISCYSQRFI
jgi:hypothetical protein